MARLGIYCVKRFLVLIEQSCTQALKLKSTNLSVKIFAVYFSATMVYYSTTVQTIKIKLNGAINRNKKDFHRKVFVLRSNASVFSSILVETFTTITKVFL